MPVEAQRLRWAWDQGRQVVLLILVTWGTATGRARPDWQPAPRLFYGCLAVAVAGWLAWIFSRPSQQPDSWPANAPWPVWILRPLGRQSGSRLANGAWVAWLTAGLLLCFLRPFGAALAFPSLALLTGAVHNPVRRSVPLAVGAAAVYVAGQFLAGDVGYWVLAGPVAFGFATMGGNIRREANRVAEQRRLTDEEKARSAALAERARIAREIHDVLAHSLAALTVQLETADALLESAAEGDRVRRARQAVGRAGQLAREGLAETRRAIGALRGETVPLSQLLDTLVAGYRADFGVPAVVRVEGESPRLSADAGLALYRGAQEAMTNVRKHAPGAPVTVELRYTPQLASLIVANGPPPDGSVTALANTGTGYGLIGLRERAELAGGTVEAGPADGGYLVNVKIPL
jgi:signal transduction histidine kinase